MSVHLSVIACAVVRHVVVFLPLFSRENQHLERSRRKTRRLKVTLQNWSDKFVKFYVVWTLHSFCIVWFYIRLRTKSSFSRLILSVFDVFLELASWKMPLQNMRMDHNLSSELK